MVFSTSWTADENQMEVRPSILQGTWYPSTSQALGSQVDTLLQAAPSVQLPGSLRALIVPHAGYAYSGRCAAHAYRALADRQYRRVIVLAPSHYGGFRGGSILPVSYYETPLGLVEVDQEAVRSLRAHPLIGVQVEAELREHSLEIQLPFLQRSLSGFKLVPLLIGQLAREEYPVLAGEIQRQVDDHTLLIASSDFTHYGPRFGYLPFDREIPYRIWMLDSHALARIQERDVEGFLHYVADTGATICGFRPIALLLQSLPEDVRGQVLDYYSSGEMTGDYTNSVSYAALVFTCDPERLDGEEKRTLLSIARDTMELYLRMGQMLEVENGPYVLTERLQRRLGTFVTLEKEGRLRGCIGNVLPNKPLYESVRDNAIHAAVRDPRFPAMAVEEVPQVRLEVSVLSTLKRVATLREIWVGRHGLLVRKGSRSGLLLPRVALDHRWDLQTFLENACLKAGLQPQDWKEGAEVYLFTTQSLAERKGLGEESV
ncbi:MAG: AmmeMemoRadiSam system protein B [Candidatus Tectomicrobia bacterium]|uniref:MEMO1 family protein HYY20_08245 n=1 Tax=Tectimicrobiota bacterium TaxID=2528274 RepID=A0A932CPC5_UNCTE|nr:AmmeMemoRadiSam system protein B [Candidatus Tectomicrobia bacterium]